MNITSLIFSSNHNSLSNPALKINSHIYTYDDVFKKAKFVASALIDSGAINETIGIVGQRNLSSYVGLLGILCAGCNFTPINPKYNKFRIQSMISASNVRFLVGDKNSLELLDEEFLSKMQACIIPENIDSISKNYTLVSQNNFNFDILNDPIKRNYDDLAYINYTSGSTGIPKGVKVTHANVESFLENMKTIYPLDSGFKASQTFDLSFDPSVSDILFTWLMKGTLCVLPEKELLVPTDFIIREKITYWNSVPSIANFMMKTGNLKKNSLPDLEYSMFCGEQFPIHIAQAWREAAPNSTIENLYGPTEATIYITRCLYSKEDEKKSYKNDIVPIGKPFKNHDFLLINDEMEPIRKNYEKGEILFSGPQITQGYLNNAEKTDQAFVKFNWDKNNRVWYKTGDLGFINSDDNLECLGRIDSQIKIAGRRIEIGEIEFALSKFSKTKGSVVVPLRDDQNIVTGCVAFTLNELTKDDIVKIKENIRYSLDNVFFPKKIITIENFPKSQSGKINRKELEILAKDF